MSVVGGQNSLSAHQLATSLIQAASSGCRHLAMARPIAFGFQQPLQEAVCGFTSSTKPKTELKVIFPWKSKLLAQRIWKSRCTFREPYRETQQGKGNTGWLWSTEHIVGTPGRGGGELIASGLGFVPLPPAWGSTRPWTALWGKGTRAKVSANGHGEYGWGPLPSSPRALRSQRVNGSAQALVFSHLDF